MRPINTSRSLVALPIALLAACASAPKRADPATTRPPQAATAPAASTAPLEPIVNVAPRAPDAVESGLVFVVEPPEAEISVDGRPLGTVADLAGDRGLLRLAPGIYQVSLKATGYATWRAEVALRSGTETLRVKLAKKP